MHNHEHHNHHKPDHMAKADLCCQPDKPKHDHGAHAAHGGHGNHHAHMAGDFKKRFFLALGAVIPLLILSPGFQHLLKFSIPSFTGQVWVLLALATFICIYAAWPFYTGAADELKQKRLGMMVLVSLAVLAGYVYSVFVSLFEPSQMDFFWEISTLVLILLLGHWLEMRAVVGTGDALTELSKLIPAKASKIEGAHTKEVETSSLQIDDLILVKPGGKVPVDGIIVEGSGSVNEAMITGESNPVSKSAGDKVIGGTIDIDGSLKVKVSQTGQKTALAQIMALVAQAQNTKPGVQRLADIAAHYLTIVAIVAGLGTFVAWYFIVGREAAFAMSLAIGVIVIACPHALGLAIPTVTTIASTVAAKKGILIKDMKAVEAAERATHVVFDKTGTLTTGQFELTDVLVENPGSKTQSFTGTSNYDESKTFAVAMALASYSEHPVSKAVVEAGKKHAVTPAPIENFSNLPGQGVKASHEHLRVLFGNAGLMRAFNVNIEQAMPVAEKLSKEGKTVSFLAAGEEVRAIFAFADQIKESSRAAVEQLKQEGFKIAMLTGDNYPTAEHVARQLNLDEYFAEVKPSDKDATIKQLQKEGHSVVMVGDGVNDAPALTQANVGIAIGAGTDVAIEAGQIVLMKNDPMQVAEFIALSKRTKAKMRQNIWWATGYNLVAIPLAAGVLAKWGVYLRPEWGALAMSASSVIVVANALRLKN